MQVTFLEDSHRSSLSSTLCSHWAPSFRTSSAPWPRQDEPHASIVRQGRLEFSWHLSSHMFFYASRPTLGGGNWWRRVLDMQQLGEQWTLSAIHTEDCFMVMCRAWQEGKDHRVAECPCWSSRMLRNCCRHFVYNASSDFILLARRIHCYGQPELCLALCIRAGWHHLIKYITILCLFSHFHI